MSPGKKTGRTVVLPYGNMRSLGEFGPRYEGSFGVAREDGRPTVPISLRIMSFDIGIEKDFVGDGLPG